MEGKRPYAEGRQMDLMDQVISKYTVRCHAHANTTVFPMAALYHVTPPLNSLQWLPIAKKNIWNPKWCQRPLHALGLPACPISPLSPCLHSPSALALHTHFPLPEAQASSLHCLRKAWMNLAPDEIDQFLVIFKIWARFYLWNDTEKVISLRIYFLLKGLF